MVCRPVVDIKTESLRGLDVSGPRCYLTLRGVYGGFQDEKMKIGAALSFLAVACVSAPAPQASEEPQAVGSRPPMDSATIERLCAKPDSVRAGKADCVLKDQSAPPPSRPPPPA
jgi:hypothetical protein